jgi:hypothetical protein
MFREDSEKYTVSKIFKPKRDTRNVNVIVDDITFFRWDGECERLPLLREGEEYRITLTIQKLKVVK